jgi:hypothetical protein
MIKLAACAADLANVGHTRGCTTDIERAALLVETLPLPEAERLKFFRQCASNAHKVITENWDAVSRLATRLHDAGSLNAEEIRTAAGQVIKFEPEPEPAPVAAVRPPSHVMPIINDDGRQVGEILRVRGKYIALSATGWVGEFLDKIEAAHAILRAASPGFDPTVRYRSAF